ncbi:MAG: chaperonin GroEL [Planctomycetes bacterium]|nr:chaperonin GroEL [Planctomycetota bacterium]
MMQKQLMFDDEARHKILAGSKAMFDTIRTTLGPTGRNVLIDKSFGNPEVVKDGNTISKEIELPDPFENMGAKMVAEASSKTSDVVGDGTATAAILTHTLYEKGLKYITAGANPVSIKKGIERATQTVVDNLKDMSVPVKNKSDYEHIAAISANYNQTIGAMIADAMDKVGKEGVITVEEGKARETVLEFTDGLMFDKGYISPYFITDPDKLTCVLNDPYILLYEKKITNIQEMVPLLESVVQVGASLLIIAEEVENEALTTLVMNRLQGVLKCCAVKAPAFGDRKKSMMEDIAVVTSGKAFLEDLGVKLEDIKLNDLGRAKSVKIDKDNTTIIGGAGKKSAIDTRINQIRHQIKATTSNYDKEKFEERLAKLAGGVAIIRVGATTETELKDRKSLIQNAVNSTKAARDEGIVPGGGIAYLKTASVLAKLEKDTEDTDEKFGIRIVAEALETPLKQIAHNTGQDGSMVVAEVKERNVAGKEHTGFDAATGEFVDMIKKGIVDPTKMLRTALQNAASIAGLMLASRTLITELKDSKEKITGSVR